MIVLCPSCNTRYRHHHEPEPEGCTAHCSRCDETFPLAEPRRTYVLIRPDRAVAPQEIRPMAIGMDDPTLADRVRDTALDTIEGETPAAMTWRVEADEEAPADTVAAASEAEAFEAEAPETETETETETEALPSTQEGVEDPADLPDEDPSGLVDVLVATVPSGVGAVLAYHLAGQQQMDPVTWAALGGAAGLLLGWGCLLWIRRKD